MTLKEFIKRYHGANADHLAGELFNEAIGDDQDLSYPNNFIMILMHQCLVLKQRLDEVEKRHRNEDEVFRAQQERG